MNDERNRTGHSVSPCARSINGRLARGAMASAPGRNDLANRRPCACKGTRSARSCQRADREALAQPPPEPDLFAFSTVYLTAAILDSPRPSQYGPRGLGAAEPCDLVRNVAGVESMADDARETMIANNRTLTRPRSPRGSSVSANGSATSSRPSVRIARRSVPPPMPRQWRAAFGSRPNWSLGFGWRRHRLALDRWLGISPWAIIVFVLFGFAAGILNLMRSAGVVRNTLDPPGSKR